MDVKKFKQIIKAEGLKDANEIRVKVSIQVDDEKWQTVVLPIESYTVKRDGSIELACCLWQEE